MKCYLLGCCSQIVVLEPIVDNVELVLVGSNRLLLPSTSLFAAVVEIVDFLVIVVVVDLYLSALRLGSAL
jgi:hypothetical protein